jgi:nitrite reductase/ring-hydroxylating ferredoxin subunit
VTFSRVLDLDSLWPGEMSGVAVGAVKVLLVNIDGTVVAYLDRCAHLGIQLSKGKLHGYTLVCSAHAWCYDARTGKGENPACAQLRRLPVKIEQDQIFVDVTDGC